MGSSFAFGETAGATRRSLEARKARRRLYPVTALYTLCSAAMLALCAVSETRVRGLAFYALGFIVWTLVEYAVHRHILHGRFPDGPGLVQHFLHERFDHLHWEHHSRPWDGNHVNGTLVDTGLFVALLFGLSLLFPAWTASMLIAGVIQAYVIEEWVHHSVHFCRFDNRYFRYIRRHHLYHHSAKGSEAGYGLTSGFWDVVYGTRFSAEIRRVLHRKRGAYLDAAPVAPATPLHPGGHALERQHPGAERRPLDPAQAREAHWPPSLTLSATAGRAASSPESVSEACRRRVCISAQASNAATLFIVVQRVEPMGAYTRMRTRGPRCFPRYSAIPQR